MGDLQFLRIWHDNSGLGPNGSWYLSFIVFRDVQTGKKYEFIVNNWLAVEHGDGQVGGAAALNSSPCRLLVLSGRMVKCCHHFESPLQYHDLELD